MLIQKYIHTVVISLENLLLYNNILPRNLDKVILEMIIWGIEIEMQSSEINQRELNRLSQFSKQKWKFWKILLLKNDVHLGFISDKNNWGGCPHLLLVNDASSV